jgi:hypothetical protein
LPVTLAADRTDAAPRVIGAIPVGRRAIGASADERRDWRPKHDRHVLRGCEAVLVFPVVKLLDCQSRGSSWSGLSWPGLIRIRTNLSNLG